MAASMAAMQTIRLDKDCIPWSDLGEMVDSLNFYILEKVKKYFPKFTTVSIHWDYKKILVPKNIIRGNTEYFLAWIKINKEPVKTTRGRKLGIKYFISKEMVGNMSAIEQMAEKGVRHYKSTGKWNVEIFPPKE
jgi:hypothetical protein